MGRSALLLGTALALLLTAAFVSPDIGWAGAVKKLGIGSGNTAGVYYSASAALEKVVSKHVGDTGFRLANKASQGSKANINNVLQGKLAFGLAQADMLFKAAGGLGPWAGSPQPKLQAVFGLYTEDLTFVAADDAAIAHLADLKGKRVNIGAPGSGDNENARAIFDLVGLKTEEIKLSEEPAAIASDLLQAGEIDAYLFTAGHPNFSIREASSGQRKIHLLSLDQAVIDKFTAARPFIKAVSVPTDAYPGLTVRTPAASVGVKAILFTSADTDQETVYRLVKAIIGDLDLLRRQHPALAGLTPKDMAAVPVLTFHPGAERYFREAGLRP